MTDNLNKADEELRENISQLLYNATYGEFDATMDALMELLEYHIQAKQLEARNQVYYGGEKLFVNLLMERGGIEFSEDFTADDVLVRVPKNVIRKYFDEELGASKYQLPGFENTMSDLDKLTIKEEK